MVYQLVPFQKRALFLLNRCFLFSFSLITFFILISLAPVRAGELPKFFTYLKAVDPSILQEMRYYGSHNFLGRRVKGYKAAECILTMPAARALKKVQKRLRPKGLSLKVYDCYRPQRAVNDFIAWAKKPTDIKTKAEFYPTLKKSKLFGLGYIARRSTHSRGSTVDLTIVPLPPKTQPEHNPSKQTACFEEVDSRYKDNSLDFGTGYDCFHEKSHTKSRVVFDARKNRDLLVREMAAVGFENYRKEWWHFSLKNEPYRRKHFDFPITPYKGKASSVVSPQSKTGTPAKVEREVVAPRVRLTDKVPAQENNGMDEEKGALSDTPEIVSTKRDKKNKALRVVCVASDDVLNVREAAHHKAKLVAALPFDAVEIQYKECVGDISLKEWHGLDAIGRRTMASPWCHILSYKLTSDDTAVEAEGWVSGAFVVGEFKSRPCKIR
jgi:D-alanyl-D-alanine dipeptidase